MSIIQCDMCPRTAKYALIVQDLVKAKDGLADPVLLVCVEHTTKRINACIAVVGRYSFTIDPLEHRERRKK